MRFILHNKEKVIFILGALFGVFISNSSVSYVDASIISVSAYLSCRLIEDIMKKTISKKEIKKIIGNITLIKNGVRIKGSDLLISKGLEVGRLSSPNDPTDWLYTYTVSAREKERNINFTMFVGISMKSKANNLARITESQESQTGG